MGRLRVGLTGGLASGKSAVARRLAAAGIEVVDADALVAELYRPGGAGAAAVAALFGADGLAPGGGVDKLHVARRVFDDPAALARLEAAIHPVVRRRFAEIAARSAGVVALEATKLVEAGYAPDFDLVVTVEADEASRLARAVARGLSPEEARARLAAQGDGATRRRAAQVVIANDGSLAELEAKADALAADLLRRTAAAAR
jgi:dephospho-CoA kinase